MTILLRSAAAVVVVLAPALVNADEAELRSALVGRQVMAKVDLPATRKGLDYYPERSTTFDNAKHQKRIRQSGIGVLAGDVVTVSKINVKGKYVEFHLGEGGNSQLPSHPSTYVPKSDYEKQLEKQLKSATKEQKKTIERALARERDRRRREERLLKAVAEQEYQMALSQRTPEQWALLAGSRVNVRFDHSVPPEALTPAGLMSLLGDLFDFNPQDFRVPVAAPPVAADAPVSKGQSRADVDAALGPPKRCSEQEQGMLVVSICTYPLGEATLEARFVDDVLVRYVLSSD
jgi:hypothetical protein